MGRLVGPAAQQLCRCTNAATGPLVPYYTERGILVAVDANQPPDSVTSDIQARLTGLSRPGGG